MSTRIRQTFSKSAKASVSGAIAMGMLGAAISAGAHTGVKSQTIEGVREDNALRIGHGCTASERGVVAQSVVFPTDVPELAASDPSVALTDLSQVIAQGSLAGLIASIQDRSIFLVQGEIVDDNGNVIGFQARSGLLRPELAGRVPFQFSAPNFLSDSCARRLLIKIAIADVCNVRPPAIDPGKLNLWIPDNGSRFAVEGAAAGVDGIGEPATLIVNRNPTSNALPSHCGAGYDVTVTPSAAQVDRDLPIGSYWPSTGSRRAGDERH